MQKLLKADWLTGSTLKCTVCSQSASRNFCMTCIIMEKNIKSWWGGTDGWTNKWTDIMAALLEGSQPGLSAKHGKPSEISEIFLQIQNPREK